MIENPKLLDSPEIDGTSTPISAMHSVALVEQQLRQIGAVLAGNSGNNRIFHNLIAQKTTQNKQLAIISIELLLI